MAPPIQRIPVIVLTGFLGSGKTTLLRTMLDHPDMANAAVLINELGEVGLDHHLVWGAAGDTTLVLENGCICCSISDDFIATLQDLFWKRLHRKIPRFDRVIIETTGVADPGPIVHFMLADPLLLERYRIESVVTTVDASRAAAQLDAHWESVRQVACADVLLLTKTDLAKQDAGDELVRRLQLLNPTARLERAMHGQISPQHLFGGISGSGAVCDTLRLRVVKPQRHALQLLHPAGARHSPPRARHDSRIRSYSFDLPQIFQRALLEQGLRAVLSQLDAKLLRLKGLVQVEGETAPMVVQAVGPNLFPLESLGYPLPVSGRYSLVFITDGLQLQEVTEAVQAWLAV